MGRRSAAVLRSALALTLGVVPLCVSTTATAQAATAQAATIQATTATSALTPFSRIFNRTNLSVVTRKDWTCSSGTTGSSSTGCVGGATKTLYGWGDDTGFSEDWDVVQVDAGWCYSIKFVLPYKEWTLTFNRAGLSNLYVKVEDHGDAYVMSQKYGGC